MICYVVYNITNPEVYGFLRFYDKKLNRFRSAYYQTLFSFAWPQNKTLFPFQSESSVGW